MRVVVLAAGLAGIGQVGVWSCQVTPMAPGRCGDGRGVSCLWRVPGGAGTGLATLAGL